VQANDWVEIEPADLLWRSTDWRLMQTTTREVFDSSDVIADLGARLRLIVDGDMALGRASICPHLHGGGDYAEINGVATIGGLRSSAMRRVAGVLVATSRRAARDVGVPVATFAALARWATEQGKLAVGKYSDRESITIAEMIWAFGGDTGQLPVALTPQGYKRHDELRAHLNGFDEVSVLSTYDADNLMAFVEGLTFERNIVIVPSTTPISFLYAGTLNEMWPLDIDDRWSSLRFAFRMGSSMGPVIAALAELWSIPWQRLADWESPHISWEERPIGYSGDREFTEGVYTISRVPRPAQNGC
jgi:hypothetical protein